MFLLEVAEAPWWVEILKQGGLAVVVLLLLYVSFTLLKWYLKEKKDRTNELVAHVKVVSDLKDANEKNMKEMINYYNDREDRKLKEQADRYDKVIASKDELIAQCDEKGEKLQEAFRADLTKFLQDSIEARHQMSNGLDNLRRVVSETHQDLIRALKN